MPEFIPGLQLSALFYEQAVRPLLEQAYPRLDYSAVRIDYGSDVLGFDTPRSMDHDWGPKFTLLLKETDFQLTDELNTYLGNHLPLEFAGFPTCFGSHEDGTGRLVTAQTRPFHHGITISTTPRFLTDYIGWDGIQPLHAVDWLTFPPQKLRTLTCGRVFFDSISAITSARQSLAWYPHDVWLYLLASQWQRIDQEEPFMGRCAEAGDEIGSRLVAARQIRELMLLCFLMEKTYPAYTKWFGTAFSRLTCAAALQPVFETALSASNWKAREDALGKAYLYVANLHNSLAITPFLEPDLSFFWGRPYKVIHSGRYVNAIHVEIHDPEVRSITAPVGAVYQFADSTDVLETPATCKALAGIYKVKG